MITWKDFSASSVASRNNQTFYGRGAQRAESRPDVKRWSRLHAKDHTQLPVYFDHRFSVRHEHTCEINNPQSGVLVGVSIWWCVQECWIYLRLWLNRIPNSSSSRDVFSSSYSSCIYVKIFMTYLRFLIEKEKQSARGVSCCSVLCTPAGGSRGLALSGTLVPCLSRYWWWRTGGWTVEVAELRSGRDEPVWRLRFSPSWGGGRRGQPLSLGPVLLLVGVRVCRHLRPGARTSHRGAELC